MSFNQATAIDSTSSGHPFHPLVVALCHNVNAYGPHFYVKEKYEKEFFKGVSLCPNDERKEVALHLIIFAARTLSRLGEEGKEFSRFLCGFVEEILGDVDESTAILADFHNN